jgi:hypothetical protein
MTKHYNCSLGHQARLATLATAQFIEAGWFEEMPLSISAITWQSTLIPSTQKGTSLARKLTNLQNQNRQT